jgi:hypothetical protein
LISSRVALAMTTSLREGWQNLAGLTPIRVSGQVASGRAPTRRRSHRDGSARTRIVAGGTEGSNLASSTGESANLGPFRLVGSIGDLGPWECRSPHPQAPSRCGRKLTSTGTKQCRQALPLPPWNGEAVVGPRVKDARLWQPLVHEPVDPVPSCAVLLAALRQHAHPKDRDWRPPRSSGGRRSPRCCSSYAA